MASIIYRILILILLFTLITLNLFIAEKSNLTNFLNLEKLNNFTKIEEKNQASEKIEYIMNDQIINLLKQGNNTIFIRHSHKISNDFQQGFDVLEMNGYNTNYIKKNNCLTLRGKEEAKFIGLLFKKLNIPINKVYTSPICRCLETASIAFGKYEKIDYLAYDSITNRNNSKKIKKLKKEIFLLLQRKILIKSLLLMEAHHGEVGINLPVLGQSGLLIYNNDSNSVKATIEFNELMHTFYNIQVYE